MSGVPGKLRTAVIRLLDLGDLPVGLHSDSSGIVVIQDKVTGKLIKISFLGIRGHTDFSPLRTCRLPVLRPRGIRRSCAAARLLRLWFQITRGCMSVCLL